jgi:hypothetical protein
MNEPAPLSNSLVSPESFTSGSIRVDALAREIAHSPVSLPAAIPGFEPYSIDEPKAEPPRLRVEAPPQVQATFAQATFDKIDRVLDDPDLDTWPEGSTEAEGKPWPKPRAQSRIEHEVELESEPEPVPAPTIMPQANVEPEIVVVPNAKIEREAGVDVSPEQNAFINFDSEAEVARGAEQDDAEIAALFEGEPVNASDIRDESSKSSRSPGAAPAYIAWLEPIPDAEEPVVFKQKEPVANSQLSQQSITSLPPATEAEHSSAQYIDEPGVNPAMQQHSESLPESTQEQFRQPVIDQLAGQASEQYTTADASQPEIAEEILQVIPQKIVQEVPKEIEQERPSTDRSRAAIEEGFRQAQAAFASTEFEQQPAGEGSYPEPAPPVVPADSAPMTFASSLTSLTSAPSVFGVPAGRSLKADIDRLLGNLDSELEMVSTKGSEAFAKRDLKGAERMIKLAEVLSELKDSLTKLRDEHGQDLS